MKSLYIFIIFLIVAAAQLFVPAQMILNREDVLKTGMVFKFKTRPIDPEDPFRGKYISLGFESTSYKTMDSIWERNQKVYAYLDIDSLGFAKIDKVSRELLIDDDKDFLEVKVNRYDNYSNKLNIEYPFNRYYMEETKAYDAEVAVRENLRDSVLTNVYALVHIKNGESVLKDVIINDMSIKDHVKRELESN